MVRLMTIVFLLPFFAQAQSSRSANELAHESVKEYIEQKLFLEDQYNAGDFGSLKKLEQQNDAAVWFLKHDFETTPKSKRKKESSTPFAKHSFIFYLDKKMKVVRADTNEIL